MSIFSIFIKKNDILFPFRELKVDMHSHLIPGIDDGSKSMEESVTLINGLFQLGYEQLITTPHIMQDLYPNTPEIINAGLKTLQQEFGVEKIQAAAEYYLDEFIIDQLESGNRLLSFNGHFVLIEFGFMSAPIELFKQIEMIKQAGYQPILAHPERYGYYHQFIEPLIELKANGCFLQANLLSFSGYYGQPIRKAAIQLAELGLIDLLGTDLHNSRHLEQLRSLKLCKGLKMILEKGVKNPELLVL